MHSVFVVLHHAWEPEWRQMGFEVAILGVVNTAKEARRLIIDKVASALAEESSDYEKFEQEAVSIDSEILWKKLVKKPYLGDITHKKEYENENIPEEYGKWTLFLEDNYWRGDIYSYERYPIMKIPRLTELSSTKIMREEHEKLKERKKDTKGSKSKLHVKKTKSASDSEEYRKHIAKNGAVLWYKGNKRVAKKNVPAKWINALK